MRFTFSSAAALYLVALAAFGPRQVEAQTYEEIRVKDDDLCIGVDSTSTGTVLKLYDCDDSNSRRLWQRDGDLLRLKENTSRCATRSGNKVVLQSCSSSSTRQWTYDNNGDLEFKNDDDDDYCMYYSSLDTGSQIRVEECNGNSDQEWDFNGSGSSGGSNKYYNIRVSEDTDLCVGVSSASSGRDLSLNTCSNSNNRLWKLDGDELLRIKGNSKLCAERRSNKSVELKKCDKNNQNQHWTYSDNGDYEFKNDNFCLEYSSLTTSSTIRAKSCSKDLDQQFDYGPAGGKFHFVRASNGDNLCISASSASTGTELRLETCTSSNLRLWKLDGDILRLKDDAERCAARSGSRLILRSCDDDSSLQRWTYNKDDELEFKNDNNGDYCLEYSSLSTGSRIEVQRCNGESDQHWDYGSGGRSYHIRASDDTKLCIGTGTTSSSEGQQLKLVTCTNSDSDDTMLWKRDDELLRLKENLQLCAEASGSRLLLENCDYGNNKQKWEYRGTINFKTAGNICIQYSKLTAGSAVRVESCDGDSNQGATDQQWDFGTGGRYSQIKLNEDNERCIGANGASTGTELRLLTCTGSNLRKWKLDGEILRLKENPWRCAEKDADRVILQDCDSTNRLQRWGYDDNDNLEFKHANSRDCMQYSSLDEGSAIELEVCDSVVEQEWDYGIGGTYSEIQVRDSRQKCIGVASDSEGRHLTLYSCGSGSQLRLWRLDENGLLRLKENPQRCAERSGSEITLERCNSARRGQRWDYDANRQYQFRDTDSSPRRCMEYLSDRVGSAVEAEDCDGEKDQQWLFLQPGLTSERDTIFFDSAFYCNKCIGVDKIEDDARVLLMDCDNTERMRWSRFYVPSNGGSLWCSASNSDLCVRPKNMRTLTGRLILSSITGRGKRKKRKIRRRQRRIHWWHGEGQNNVRNAITGLSDGVCVSLSNNQVLLEECTTSGLQSWRIGNSNDRANTCTNIRNSEPNPKSPSGGTLVEVASDDGAGKCIGMVGCTNENWNCAGARLAIIDCVGFDESSALVYWEQSMVPGNGGKWCIRGADKCVNYSGNTLNLVSSLDESQGMRWYFEVNKITALESSDLCVTREGARVFVDNCGFFGPSSNQQWKIG